MTAVGVLQAVANGYEYGFDVIEATGLPSGTVYPALGRLERDGLLRSAWEDEAEAFAQGRPARRYYRVSFTERRRIGLRPVLPVPRQGIEPCLSRLKAGGFAIEACEANGRPGVPGAGIEPAASTFKEWNQCQH